MGRVLFCNSWVRLQDSIICPLNDANAIYEIKEDRTRLLCSLKDGMNEEYKYSRLLRAGDKIIGVPFFSDRILIIDEKTFDFKMKKININPEYASGGKVGLFWEAYAADEYVYMFGFCVPVIARLNLITEEVDVFSTDVKVSENNEELFCGLGLYVRQEKIFLPLWGRNLLLGFDRHLLKTETIKLPDDFCGYSAVTCGKEFQYLIGSGKDNGKLMILNPDTGDYDIICFSDETADAHTILFFPPVRHGEKLFILPNMGRNAYVIDLKDRLASELDAYNELIPEDDNGRPGVTFIHEEDDQIVFQRREGGTWYWLNMNDLLIEKKKKYIIWGDVHSTEEKKVMVYENQTGAELKDLLSFVQGDRG